MRSASGISKCLPAICAAMFLSLFAAESALAGTTYYISTDGSDSNSGSLSAPFRNIQKGVDMAAAGDTVLVRDGVYTDTDYDGKIVNIVRKNGTPDNWITIKSENQYGAVLDGQLVNWTHVTGWINHSGSVYWATVTHPVNSVHSGCTLNSTQAGCLQGSPNRNNLDSGIKKSSIAALINQNDFYYDSDTQRLYRYYGSPNIRYIIASEGASYGIMLANSSYIKLDGFEIKRTEAHLIDVGTTDNILIHKNKLHDAGRSQKPSDQPGIAYGAGTGIFIAEAARDITIDSNIIFDVGRLPASCAYDYNNDHGLYLVGDKVSIVNNLFYDIKSGWPIQLAGYTDPETNPEGLMGVNIINNTFYGRNPGRDGHIILWTQVHDVVVENNISYTPGAYFIENNTGHPYQGRDSTNNPPRNIIRNNLVYSSTSVRIANYTTEALYTTFADNTVGTTAALDPLFVNPSAYDFHLQPASPAINKGNAVGLTADIEGKPYIGPPDLGAYEYQGAGTPPAPPALLRIR